jgi:outer membrane protein assembly factor BamB
MRHRIIIVNGTANPILIRSGISKSRPLLRLNGAKVILDESNSQDATEVMLSDKDGTSMPRFPITHAGVHFLRRWIPHRVALVPALFHALVGTLLCGGLMLPPKSASAENWPRFRGPNGSGHSSEKGFPAQWNPKAAKWVRDIPGVSHSSPVIWDNRVFVTSAELIGDNQSRRTLHALKTDTGEIAWSASTTLGVNGKHAKSSFANASPTVDSERVYAAWADNENFLVEAFDFGGKRLWKVDLGPFASQHGQGASPILFENLLIMVNDQDTDSFIVALDRKSGEIVWKKARESRETSYATPAIFEPAGGGPAQLICVNGVSGVTALDPWTGELQWASEPFPRRTVASPVIGASRIFAGAGQGAKGTDYFLIDPLAKPRDGKMPVLLKLDRLLPYVPCCLYHNDLLFLWGDGGVVSCLNAITGKVFWTERVGGKFTASPILLEDRLYNIDEAGKLSCLSATEKYELLGTTDLGEESYSTLAVSNGAVYAKTFSKMFSLPTAAK